MKFREFISNTLPRRSKRKGRPAADTPVVTCNRSVVEGDITKDACTSTEPCVNINVFASECCGHRQHADDLSLSDTESRGYSSDSNYNTIPRARSRIRTNPWLPSPKTSPPLSPLTTPGRYPDSRTLVQTPDSAMEISWSALSDSSSNDLLRSNRKTQGHGSDSDVDSLLDQSIHSEDPFGDLSAVSPVSFEYERALESSLEAPGVGRFVGSRDSLNWANRESGLLDDLLSTMRNRQALSEEEELIDRRRASSEESGASSSTLCNGIPDEEHSERRPLAEQKSLDSGFYSAHSVIEETPDRKRSVQEIRSSLQAKVLRLRQEKRLVDEKIREAREEERMRVQHIAHFRRQVSSARKYVLLETLDRLRERLSNQSERLQDCYDTVLNRQQKICRQQRA